MISALAPGVSSIAGLSRGHDVLGTARALRDLGISIVDGPTVAVHGGIEQFSSPQTLLDCGNSGTTIRLLLGLLAGLGLDAVLIGDESLSSRPMDRVKVPLELMGASLEGVGERCQPPVRISRTHAIKSIDYCLPVPSAQVKSAILLAALFADDVTTIRETSETRIHTEEMLSESGVLITRLVEGGIRTILTPGLPASHDWVIPGDPSQAAFFVIAGLLGEESTVKIPGLYSGPARSGYLDVLRRMGGEIEIRSSDTTMTVIASSSELRGTEIMAAEIPSLDEVPILSVAAAAATGTTIFRDVAELRVKESDRFRASANLARNLGATVDEVGDDLFITGRGSASFFNSVSVDPMGDHRMAMSAAIAGAVGTGAVITDESCVETSFPGFFVALENLR